MMYFRHFILFTFFQSTREALVKKKEEFGDAIGKENDVGLIIDGKVRTFLNGF